MAAYGKRCTPADMSDCNVRSGGCCETGPTKFCVAKSKSVDWPLLAILSKAARISALEHPADWTAYEAMAALRVVILAVQPTVTNGLFIIGIGLVNQCGAVKLLRIELIHRTRCFSNRSDSVLSRVCREAGRKLVW